MRTKAIFILFVFALSFSSCSKNQALFDVDSYLELTLVAGTPADRVFGFEKEVVFPFSTQLGAFGVTADEILSVNGSSCLVYPKFASDTDLSFINEITIDAIDPDDFSRTKEVFYFEQFSLARDTELELFPSLPNIKDFIRDEKLFLQVEFIFNTPPPRTFELAFELKFGAIEIE